MPVITLENGTKIRTFRPPPDFDPLSASAPELEQNGFPPRPDDPRLLQLYQRLFERLKGKFQYVEPTFRINRGRTHGSSNRTIATDVWNGNNWSGWVASPPTGQSFKAVHGSWVVPNAFPTTSSGWSGSSYWIGLDGFHRGANHLCQVGVQSDVVGVSQGEPFVIITYPFHQWLPDVQVQVTNLAVSPGDLMMIALCTPSGAGSTTATAYMANITSGAATSYSISGGPLAGDSAQWIIEAPAIDGKPSQLADYYEVFFSSCGATTSNNTVVAAGPGQEVDLSQGGKVIATGGLITPEIIQCSYIGPPPL